jgi:capsular exopolysaccharide synthesis family protein
MEHFRKMQSSGSQDAGRPQTLGFESVGHAQHQSMLTWEQAARVLKKRKRTFLFVTAGITIVAVVGAFGMKDVYRPVARLEIDPVGAGIKTLHEIESPVSDADQDYLETQSQVLQSDGLAMRVIRGLHLAEKGEFASGANSQGSSLPPAAQAVEKEKTPGDAAFLQEQASLAEPTSAEAATLKKLRKNIYVTPVRSSRLVEVSAEAHDPQLAKSITNLLVTQYIDQNYRNRYVSTMEASEWLSSQLSDLRQRVAESNQAVADYQKRYGLVESDDKDVPLAQLMADVNHQWSEAQADRIQAEAYARMIDLGQADSVPALREDTVYQNLLTHYADTRAQLAQAQTVYGDENQNVKKLQNESTELAAQVEAERSRILNRIRTSFAASREREEMMQQSRERLRAQMGDASSHLVEYRMLKNEAVANATLYNTLQARLKEAGIYAGLRSGNIRVVDMAPRLHEATGPHRAMMVGIGAFLGLLAGIFAVLVRESLDNTVRSPADMTEWVRAPALAVLPTVALAATSKHALADGTLSTQAGLSHYGNAPGPKLLWTQGSGAGADAIRELRTAIVAMPLASKSRVVLVSSAAAGEGKTTTALNLAAALAQQGPTCLVEGDLRAPVLRDALELKGNLGIAEVVGARSGLNEALQLVGSVPGLQVLAVNSAAANAADLLAGPAMQNVVASLRQTFDYIVIDSPPVIPFSDARTLAALADGVILVCRYAQTTRRAMARGAELFAEANATILGVVLNDMDFSSPDYLYFNYGYSWGSFNRNYGYSRRLANAAIVAGKNDPPRAKGAHA